MSKISHLFQLSFKFVCLLVLQDSRQLNSVIFSFFISLFFFFFFVFCPFRVAPAAKGGSQARGQIRAVAAGLRQSHSNTRSEPRL